MTIDKANLIAENERLKTLRSTTERDLAQELEVWKHGPSCWNCGDTGDVHDMVGEWRGECDCFAAQLINVTRERDQLKAEAEQLSETAMVQESMIEQLNAENGRLRDSYEQICTNYNQVSYASEERGRQVDLLKAENAGLRTGYEAWERAHADMAEKLREARAKLEFPDPILIQCMDSAIAEQDQIEKDAKRYRWLREPEAGSIEVVEWIGPHTASLTGDDLDTLIDAALGKGDQS